MKKIVGVTVGTALSPEKIKEKIKPVLSVNGVKPDRTGNVENAFTFEGLTEEQKATLKGEKGDDYVLTEADKNEIAEKAAELVSNAGGEGTPNAVQYIPQELTDEQQAQARANINAVDADSIPEWAMQPNKPTYTKREIGLGNVDNVEQYSEKNPPPYPVTSVNGKKGAVSLSASDVGADASGTAASAVSEHNASDKAHNDIRLLIEGLATKLSGIADSDDTTLDQLSEIVAYIKSNKSLIDSITTNKVNVSDIINNLTSNVSNKPLSAAQGVALKALIDAITVPTKVSQLENDKGYLTAVPSGYAKTADHYTKTEADNKYQAKGNYLTSVPSEYVTDTELTNKGYAVKSSAQTWTFELEDGTTVTKKVVLA